MNNNQNSYTNNTPNGAYGYGSMPYGLKPPVSQRHPIIFGLLVVLMFFAVMNVAAVIFVLIINIITAFGGELSPVISIMYDDWVFQGIIEFFVMLFGLLAIRMFGCQKCLKEKGRGIKYGIACSGYFIFIGLFAVLTNVVMIAETKPNMSPAWRIAAYLITFTLVGLTEEFYFRGVVANLFYNKHATTPAGVWTATLYSGLIFGLMHLMNGIGIINAATFEEAAAGAVGPIVQTVSATAMGILLAAIYFRCRNIWVMAGLHAFIDICAGVYAGLTTEASLSSTIDSYTPTSLIAVVPYIIATAVLLRPKKLREIIDARNGIDVDCLEYRLAAKGIFISQPPFAQTAAPSVPPYMVSQPIPNNTQLVSPNIPSAPTDPDAPNTQYLSNMPSCNADEINIQPQQNMPQGVQSQASNAQQTAYEPNTVYQPNMPHYAPNEPNAAYAPYAPNASAPYAPSYIMPYTSDKRSKSSLIKAVIAVIVIILGLHISSIALYAQVNGGLFRNSTEIFSYDYTGSPRVKDGPLFEENTESFTVPKDGIYRLTFVTLPDNSSAYVEISVYGLGSANPIYSNTYGGRCSDNAELELKADEEYTIYMTYDFSDAQDSMSYTTKITVSLDEE